MFYPIVLNISDSKITVVGAGKVAFRKCKSLVELGKSVTVVGKNILDNFYDLGNSVNVIEAEFNTSFIEDSSIVIAATNNKDLNRSIGLYCRDKNKLVNVVDDIELSNFTVPSFFKKGDLMISISTGGKSPALSAKIRKDLEKKYDDEFIEFLDLLGRLRVKIIESEKNIQKRNNILKRLVNLSLEELKEISVKFNL